MADRKARLAALAAKAGRSTTEPNNNSDDGNDQQVTDTKPTIQFRNYVPKDQSLDASSTTQMDVDDDTKPQSKKQKTNTTKEESSKSALEIALAKTSRESREAAGQNVGSGGWSTVLPVTTKKVNWDLKRDIQSKMDKLERRTQRAIVDLLRERLEKEAAEGGGDDEDSDLD